MPKCKYTGADKPSKCLIPSCHNNQLDSCHILTKGARPDLKNVPENIVYMCRVHHREQSDVGWPIFSSKYRIQKELFDRGFYYCLYSSKFKLSHEMDQKLKHDKNQKNS